MDGVCVYLNSESPASSSPAPAPRLGRGGVVSISPTSPLSRCAGRAEAGPGPRRARGVNDVAIGDDFNGPGRSEPAPARPHEPFQKTFFF